MSSELSTGKTIVILAVVIGCFAVLWPKVFYPMLTASVKPISQDIPHPHARPERPSHIHHDSMHPALREKGRIMPQRTIEKQARPGPMPGIRPPMGGSGHMVLPQAKGPGTAVSVLMPLYTIGIVIFFAYTIMKVLCKKTSEDEKEQKLKDFHLDPEYRKYVFAEEYLDSSNTSSRDHMRRHTQESSKHRNRSDIGYSETKLEDEQMDQLRQRLEDTENAMEKLMSQMGSVTDKLTAAKITEVLTQAQSQAKILKDCEDTMSSDAQNVNGSIFISPKLQKKLEEVNVKELCFKGTFVSCSDSITESLNGIELANEIIGNIDSDKTKENIIQAKTSEGNKEEPIKDAAEDFKKFEQEIIKNVENQAERAQNSIPATAEGVEEMSDIAMLSTIDLVDDYSEALETGVEISELRSFADDGSLSSHSPDIMPIIEDNVPEVNYFSISKNEHGDKHPGIEVEIPPENVEEIKAEVKPQIPSLCVSQQLANERSDSAKHGFLYDRPISPSMDQCTQTEAEKNVSVLDFQTMYMFKNPVMKRESPSKSTIENLNEIILDATLPTDSQLLVKNELTNSKFSTNGNETFSNSEPCIITSQVNLAFVGLEKQSNICDGKEVIIPKAYDENIQLSKNQYYIHPNQTLNQKNNAKTKDEAKVSESSREDDLQRNVEREVEESSHKKFEKFSTSSANLIPGISVSKSTSQKSNNKPEESMNKISDAAEIPSEE